MQPPLDEVVRAIADEIRRGVVDDLRQELRQTSATAGLPAWLTQKEAAQLARVSTRTIREWRASGKLPRSGVGRPLVERAELEALLRAGNRKAPEGQAEIKARVTSILSRKKG